MSNDDYFDESEYRICPVCYKKVETVGYLSDPMKYRVRCECTMSELKDSKHEAYMSWKITRNLNLMALESEGIGNIRYSKDFGKMVKKWKGRKNSG